MQPLANRRVLITRPRGQGSRLAELLEAAGATPILIPTIEILPPASFCALDAALTTLRSYDWLLFTSPNAVRVFTERARQLGLSPNPRRIAAIGRATADAVTSSGLAASVDLIPERAIADSFAEALRPHAPGATMLLVRAAVARDHLPESLTEAGAQVTIAAAYRTVAAQSSIAELTGLLTSAMPDAITFTSASTAENLVLLLDEAHLGIPAGIVLASIGPVTSQAMRALGLEPTVQATEATMPSLVEAIISTIAS